MRRNTGSSIVARVEWTSKRGEVMEMTETKKETSAGTEAVNETKQITEDGSETLFPHRHPDSQEHLGERENLLRSPSEEPCYIDQMRVYPNLESALAASQALFGSLLSPKDRSECN